MQQPEVDLCIAACSVVEHREPVRLVVHYADGTWLVSCGAAESPDEFTTVHVRHLFDDPVLLLRSLRELPPGHGAWREDPSYAWEIAPANEG